MCIRDRPDTVKQKVTEAEAYSTVWDIQVRLQHALPRSVVYYGPVSYTHLDVYKRQLLGEVM